MILVTENEIDLKYDMLSIIFENMMVRINLRTLQVKNIEKLILIREEVLMVMLKKLD
jgi:hypothetical protein